MMPQKAHLRTWDRRLICVRGPHEEENSEPSEPTKCNKHLQNYRFLYDTCWSQVKPLKQSVVIIFKENTARHSEPTHWMKAL